MAVSIAIPITDCKGDTNRQDLLGLLEDLEPYKDSFNEIIGLFDNCNWDFVQFFEDRFPWLSLVVNDAKALNFTKNANVGLRIIHQQLKDDAILVNQDCRLSWELADGSSANLAPVLLRLKEGGDLVSACSSESGPGPWVSWEPRFKESNRFAFYCVFISKECMDKTGYLDETFIRVFSDDDYILRAKLAGFKCCESNILVYHKGSHMEGDFTESRSGCYTERDLGIGLSQFKNKWQSNKEHADIAEDVLSRVKWDERMKCG
jgi:hypothetical protein